MGKSACSGTWPGGIGTLAAMSAEAERGITCRPIRDDDREFLGDLYASTRAEELDLLTDWSAAQKAAFLAQQFGAQHHHYQTHYADAAFDIVLDGDTPIGRRYVSRWEREIRLIDIALVPEARGRGIGTTLLRELLAEGERTGKAVSIHVERFNRALALYRRLGFRQLEDKGPYLLMEWRPASLR